MENWNPLTPTEEQAKNNPNKYWEGFLGQKITLLAEILRKGGSLNDGQFVKELNQAISEIPKNKADFISKDEIIMRTLEFCAKEDTGFSDEKLKKTYIEKLSWSLAEKLHRFDYGEVDQELQKEIEAIQKMGILNVNDIQEIRDSFGRHFSDIKMKEYADELENPKREE